MKDNDYLQEPMSHHINFLNDIKDKNILGWFGSVIFIVTIFLKLNKYH